MATCAPGQAACGDATTKGPSSSSPVPVTSPVEEKTGKKVLNISVTSDVVCPWCYIGKRKLERALKAVDQSKVDVKVSWHPFQLEPDAPAPGVDRITKYRARFGNRIEQMFAQMVPVGAQVGINFRFGGKVGNTLNAHRLTEWAARFGKQDAVVEKLFNAGFEREQDISDIAVLEGVAEAAGLPKDQASAFLKGNELTAEVQADIAKAVSRGVTGVPHFVINDKFSVSGARDPDFFVDIFKKVGVV